MYCMSLDNTLYLYLSSLQKYSLIVPWSLENTSQFREPLTVQTTYSMYKLNLPGSFDPLPTPPNGCPGHAC